MDMEKFDNLMRDIDELSSDYDGSYLDAKVAERKRAREERRAARAAQAQEG